MASLRSATIRTGRTAIAPLTTYRMISTPCTPPPASTRECHGPPTRTTSPSPTRSATSSTAFRDVYAASLAIAKQRRQPAFVIAPSRLHDIETKNRIPSTHRLYALALIYGRTLKEILSLYGIPL